MIARQPLLAKEVDMEGMTPLHWACQLGYFNIVKAHEPLLKEKGMCDAQNKDFETPLHLSCRNMSVEIVSYLISKGANINAKTRKSLTPLHIVAECNHIDIANILLNQRAKVNCRDERGRTPLHYAAERNSSDLILLLCKW